ncbi:MAG: hypothetical protein Q7J31_04465 [Syntrophales bacterium]|nr:hypothetical protein [Syntrophales bacterium]
MGKEARFRKERRNKQLGKLAQENPELFEQEWAKRLDSWEGQVWNASQDRIFLTEEEFQGLLKQHSSAKNILATIAVNRYQGVHIYLDALHECKEELGRQVTSELLGRFKRGTLIGQPLFNIVDHAKKILRECGEKAVTLQVRETASRLNNACCRALAPHIGYDIYKINQNWKVK